MSARRERRDSSRDRGKLIVAVLALLALIGAILFRGAWTQPLADDSPRVEEVAESLNGAVGGVQESVTDAVESVVGAGAELVDEMNEAVAGETEPTAPPAANFNDPIVNNAIIGYDEAGNELLTVSGNGDGRCEEIRFLLDGQVMGSVAPDADGAWALTLDDVPSAGAYMSELECEAGDTIYTAAPREFQVPEVTVQSIESAEATTENGNGLTNDVSSVVNSPTTTDDEPSSGTQTSGEQENNNSATNAEPIVEAQDPDTPDEQPTPDGSIEQPEFFIAQDLSKYVGGPLFIHGEGDPGTVIEVIFNSGTTRIADTATVNAQGKWNYRTTLIEPGQYNITAQIAGSSAEPLTSVEVPQGVVFGTKGNCVGRTPPYGTINGDTYIVNHCEFFGLIADRLGVTFEQLRAANPQIVNLNFITAGDVILIPELP